MKVWRWLSSVVVLGGLVVLAGQHFPALAQGEKDKGKNGGGGESVTLKWEAFDKKDKTFYQELTTETTQNMKVMGQDIVQKQNQTFYISWNPNDKDKDGNFVVTQKIVGVKMNIDIGGNKISYDSTLETQPQNPMADFFKVLQGLDLKLYISPKLEIQKIEGGDAFITKLAGTNPAMEPLLKNILKEKALKQMAEPTWNAFPSGPVKKGDKWSKPTELDLGPIGTYKTVYEYVYDGVEKDKGDKINVTATLTYSVPGKKNGLPFTIKSAQLSSKDGKGEAYFDRKTGRFSSSTMTMKLEGTLKIEVGGMDTDVELNQTQTATVKTMDANPVAPKAAVDKK